MEKKLLTICLLCFAFLMYAPQAASQSVTVKKNLPKQGQFERIESAENHQVSQIAKSVEPLPYRVDKKMSDEELNVVRQARLERKQAVKSIDKKIEITSKAPRQTAISTFPWTEGFEGTFPPTGWLNVDVDNDGFAWYDYIYLQDGTTVVVPGYNSTKAAGSASYYNHVGDLYPNNWLITPQLQLPTGNYDLTFYVGNVDAEYFADHYEVKVSTTGTNTADFTTTLLSETLTTAAWTKKTISLSAYSGQTIYIAFVHNQSNDNYILTLDDVTVSAGATAPELEVASANTNLGSLYVPLAHASGMLPSATVKNNGAAMTSTATLNFTITPGTYSKTATITALAANASQTFAVATTDGFTPTATSAYTLTASTNFSDAVPANNSKTSTFNVTNDYFATENGVYAGGIGSAGTIVFGNKYTLKNADVISAFQIAFTNVASSTFKLRIYSLDATQTVPTLVYESGEFDRSAAVANQLTEFAIAPQSLAAGTYLFCINQFNTVNISVGYDGVANGEFYLVTSTGVVNPYINSTYGNVAIRVKTSPATVTPAAGTTNAAINAVVSATFNNPITAATLSNVTITPNPGGVSASIAGNVLTIAHNNFAYDTQYTVTIPTTAIVGLNSPISWSFKTTLDPAACNKPTNLTAVPAVFDAKLSWTENGAGVSYSIKYGPKGFDFATAGTLLPSVNYDAGQSYYTLGSLSGSTNYDFYVMANCGPGESSEWAGPVSFKTLPDCSTVTSFPWSEGFNDASISDCWTIGNTTGGTTNWAINTSATYAVTGNSAYHNYASGDQDGWLISQKIAVPASSSLVLKFQSYNRYPGDYVKNSVLISTGSSAIGSTDFVEVWTPTAVSAAWTETIIPLTAYVGQEIYIAFRYEGNFAHAWFIDDISIVDGSLVDIAAISIVEPKNGANLTTTENVKVKLENKSTTAVANVPVKLFLDGTLIATESVPVLAGMATVEYDFTAKLNMTTVKTYSVMVVVKDPADQNAANDTIRKQVTNFGDVIIMGGATSVTACGKSFYDDGGPTANYAATTENQQLTIYPVTTGDRVKVEFESFSSYAAWEIFGIPFPGDTLFVYDGSTVAANSLIGFLTGEELTNIPAFTSYAANGALSFVFAKHGNTEVGWEANVTCFTPAAFDAGVERIVTPVSGGDANATVKVNLKNFGGTAITSMDVAYAVNNGTPIVETFTGSLAPGTVGEFTFATKIDLSAYGDYVIKAYTKLTGDANAANDTATVNIKYREGIDLYGFLAIDMTSGDSDKLIRFSTGDLATVTSLAPFAAARSAVYYSGNIYVITDVDFVKLDATSYAEVSRTAITDVILNMTYDYSSNTVYVIYIVNDAETHLGTIDLSTRVVTDIATLDNHVFGLAADLSGTLFGVDENGDLVSFNKTTGAATVIGATGFTPNYLQSMTFDYVSGRLFWAALHTGTGVNAGDLIEINKTTGVGTNLGQIGGGAEIVGLYVPYTHSSTTSMKFDNVLISPNPTTGILNISAVPENSRIDIVDMSGRLVNSFNNQTGNVTLNLNVASGVYFVKIMNGSKQQIEKLIVK